MEKICYDYKVKSGAVVKEVYNGVLDFYVDYGFASSIYDDTDDWVPTFPPVPPINGI